MMNLIDAIQILTDDYNETVRTASDPIVVALQTREELGDLGVDEVNSWGDDIATPAVREAHIVVLNAELPELAAAFRQI
jgi:hypothetical protein